MKLRFLILQGNSPGLCGYCGRELRQSRQRIATKHNIGGYFTPQVSKQLRSLALAEDTTGQDLLAEALNMLFQSRGLPMIAVISRDQATSLTGRKPLETASADGK